MGIAPPSKTRARVLLADDDPELCRHVEAELAERGLSVRSLRSAEAAIAGLESESFDVVISDIHMGKMSGIELCRHVVERRPDVPVIVITAFGKLDAAVAAIRAGAYDFVTKPLDFDALRLTIDRALQHKSLSDEVKRLRDGSRSLDFGDLVGESAPMKKLYALMDRVAESDASVVLTGESGTGKEIVARAVHARSRRADGPFVAVNCAAMPESLLESELFGHAKGAFTDARTTRTGLFVQASGGTLFLDEIGDMPVGVQPKLLRALQQKTVRPVGGDAEVPFDARIVAATHRDIESEVDERRFREDLYFRINVIRLELPPLRARGADVLLLAQRFVERFARQSGKAVVGLSAAAADKLLSYPWPGNVRELMNCIERAVALTQYDKLGVDDLPERVRDHRSAHVLVTADDPSELQPLAEVERLYVLRVLDAVGGNKSTAAKVLRLDRKTLYRKLERYEALGSGARRRASSKDGERR